MRYLVLSDIHANLEALDAVLEAAKRHRLRPGPGARRSRRLRRRSERGRRSRPRPVAARHRPRQPRQGRRAGSSRPKASTPWRAPPSAGPTRRSSDDNRDWLAALPAGPVVVDELLEICHGSPFDEDTYIFDDARRAARAAGGHAAALPVRPHARAGGVSPGQSGTDHREHGSAAAASASRSSARPLPGQPGLGRPAARRRSARRLRRLRCRRAGREIYRMAYPIERERRRAFAKPACPRCWRSGWRSAASRLASRGYGSARALRCGPFLALLLLHGAGVGGGARAEHPPDHDTQQQHGRDEDEVPGGRRADVHGYRAFRSSRAISVFRLLQAAAERPHVAEHAPPRRSRRPRPRA